MKKSKIWIRTCVHLLLYITVAAYSSEIGNPITDDIKNILLLKQNIPKDYEITVQYLPKEVSHSCWVKLNVFHLEESLKLLAQKFGNISSNKDIIETFVQMLREMRYHVANGLEEAMLEYQCHYREEKWFTAHYFEIVEDFFNTANLSRGVDKDCEPPPCPTTTTPTITTTVTSSSSTQRHSEGNTTGVDDLGKKGNTEQRVLPEVVGNSLLSLLFIAIVVVVALLLWKVKSRRNASLEQRNPEAPPLFVGVEASAPPLDNEISEKNRLNIIGAV